MRKMLDAALGRYRRLLTVSSCRSTRAMPMPLPIFNISAAWKSYQESGRPHYGE
jgi:hypothetical protein